MMWVRGTGWRVVYSRGKWDIGSHIAKSTCKTAWQAMGLILMVNLQKWPGCREWPTFPSCCIEIEISSWSLSQHKNLGGMGPTPLPISGLVPGLLSSSSLSLFLLSTFAA